YWVCGTSVRPANSGVTALMTGPVTTGGVIVTVTDFVTEPPGPVAVRLYVVVEVGETDFVPDANTTPIPLSIFTSVAFAVCHDNRALAPETMDGLSTVRVA